MLAFYYHCLRNCTRQASLCLSCKAIYSSTSCSFLLSFRKLQFPFACLHSIILLIHIHNNNKTIRSVFSQTWNKPNKIPNRFSLYILFPLVLLFFSYYLTIQKLFNFFSLSLFTPLLLKYRK